MNIQGYIIVEKATGERFGSLYESEAGAKSSWWSFAKRPKHVSSKWYEFFNKKFDQQDKYVLKALVISETNK